MNATITDYQAIQAARKFAADVLGSTHPHLVRASEKEPSLTAAAKNIRIELKRTFPGIKFSVKSERFSMGNAIRVNWTDGPTPSQVEEITCRYSAGDFDGMTDSYNYRDDHAWVDAFGSSKYISTNRDISPELAQKGIDYVWEKFHMREQKITPEQLERGEAYNMQVSEGQYSGYWSVQNQVYKYANSFDCTTGNVIEE